MSQFAIGPMYTPRDKRSMFTKRTFRLIYAIAFNNDYAIQEQLSDYPINVNNDVGHYLDIKTDFWF